MFIELQSRGFRQRVVDLASLLDADVVAGPERRRACRYNLSLAVIVRTKDGIELETRAEDFSLSGFRISSPVMLSVGAKVHVYCRSRQRRQAIVAWQRNDQIGFRFRHMMNPDQMEAWFDR